MHMRIDGSSSPAPARRRLSAPQLAEQVRATLHRWPTRHEWRELVWLLVWFVLILLADVLAVRVNERAFSWGWPGADVHTVGTAEQTLHWTAWVLQGAARAGFYATFAYSLYHAWGVGLGALIARILQLKLIHTLLVVAAGLGIGHLLERWTHTWSPYGYVTDLPVTFDARVICIGLLIVAGLLALLRPARFVALGVALAATFLYFGGPIASQQHRAERTFVTRNLVELSDGTLEQERRSGRRQRAAVSVYEPTPELLLRFGRQLGYRAEQIDAERNLIVVSGDRVRDLPGHVKSWMPSDPLGQQELAARRHIHNIENAEAVGAPRLQGPVVAPGAGLGWLAAPIPLLGVIGLLALVVVMGRRGVLDFVLYALLAAAALIATLTPFMVGQPYNDMFDFNPLGMVHTPFPGFESLMIIPLDELLSSSFAATLVLGLVLSAGIPWLLTALFLRPARSRKVPERELAG